MMKKRMKQIWLMWLCMFCLSGCQASEEMYLVSQNPSEEVSEEAVIKEPPTEYEKKKLLVHVCGAVQKPGVYELSEGDRISDAIKLAGGMTKEADEDYLNLAQVITDGMQIRVPTKAEAKEMPAGSSVGQKLLVNINTADEAALCTLTGIGSSRAKSIIAYREKHGKFTCIEDIMKVSGIKESSFEKIKDEITV